MLPLLLQTLLSNGLGLIGNAVLAKGKDVIEKELGVDLEKEVQTPEGMQKLAQLQNEKEETLLKYALENRKLDLEETKMYVGDVANARDTNVKIQESPNASWIAKNCIYCVALLVVVGGGWMIYTSNEADVRMAAASAITLVLTWFFGTTKNSGAKDTTIANLLKGQQNDAR